MTELETLAQWIRESSSAVFFGGAGVSTESGIPDFRSVDGLYNQRYDEPPETIISHSYFEAKPEKFYRFYKDKMLCLEAKPNAAHKRLAEWEAAGHLCAVVTQNIDGLHQAAGSKRVYELHGSVHRNYCTHCRKFFDAKYVKESDGIPRCDSCGGLIKPDVVLYEEGLDGEILRGAVNAIAQADLLIIGGTSLVVYPAAGLVNYYRGNRLVIVNKAPTPADRSADLVLQGPIGELFSQIEL
ncbi:MAG: NAD-dependent protein deacylase [Oscillospiraceae bacterium]|nr:NAD-dependent protein deacylase [Oscillospiraceae bacterium]MBP3520643.1 NAD-dependent protein deacylase [Oscillospiraceae bacterium]